jgi:hypothetical protein
MDPSIPTVSVNLWRADVVVLYDWLMSVDLNSVPITHPAEKQALADLLTRIETETDIPGVTQPPSPAPPSPAAQCPDSFGSCGSARGGNRSGRRCQAQFGSNRRSS